ncbi:MAG: hypothetical protein L6R19_11415 [Alphaproteobacteria bacterium]|nr:hypothetical protein [Alphaproteobacteria bacterium]
MDTGAPQRRISTSALSPKPDACARADDARAGEGHARAGEGHARAFLAFVRKLERNWPLSAAIILLAIVALSILKSG